VHITQKILLKRLFTQNRQRYSSLTYGYSYEDNIVFHLKKLLKEGYVDKIDGTYSITTKGVKKITIFDVSLAENSGIKTFFIGFLCNYNKEYLIKEHPHGVHNFYNLPSGKPRFGEDVGKALVRTFAENSGLILKPSEFEFLSLHLKTVKTSQGETLFDDAFTIYRVKIGKSQREKMKLRKQIKWMTEDEIKKLPNYWPEIDICIIKKDFRPYRSYKFISDYILG